VNRLTGCGCRAAVWRHDPNVWLSQRRFDPGRSLGTVGVLTVSYFCECVERAVMFLDGVAIGQSPPEASDGRHDHYRDQHDQEKCAHQGDPLMASRLMSKRDYSSSPRITPFRSALFTYFAACWWSQSENCMNY
jgi:hypothetical protein